MKGKKVKLQNRVEMKAKSENNEQISVYFREGEKFYDGGGEVDQTQIHPALQNL